MSNTNVCVVTHKDQFTWAVPTYYVYLLYEASTKSQNIAANLLSVMWYGMEPHLMHLSTVELAK